MRRQFSLIETITLFWTLSCKFRLIPPDTTTRYKLAGLQLKPCVTWLDFLHVNSNTWQKIFMADYDFLVKEGVSGDTTLCFFWPNLGWFYFPMQIKPDGSNWHTTFYQMLIGDNLFLGFTQTKAETIYIEPRNILRSTDNLHIWNMFFINQGRAKHGLLLYLAASKQWMC